MQGTALRNHREYLDSLVCGLSFHVRKNRLLGMLKAFADDSGTMKEGPVFILAGYVASIDPWNALSDEWQEVLDDPLQDGSCRLEYFKMTQADNQTYCFDGWSKTDCEKVVMRMAAIIPKHVLYAVRVTIGALDFQEVQAQYPHHQQSPYELLFNHVMMAAIHRKKTLNIEDKIEFIFDEQGREGKRAKARFMDAFHRIPKEMSSHIAGEPLFKDDKQVLPLQAADLFAWQLRKYHYDSHRKGERIADSEVRPALDLLLQIPEIKKDFIGQEVYEDFDRLKRIFPSGLPPLTI